LEALRLGAVEVLAKPGGPYSVGELQRELAGKIRAAAVARIGNHPGEPPPEPASNSSPEVLCASEKPGSIIAIGASTGGTEAIQAILTRLPAESPGIVITQHIPPFFSLAFANRLNQICRMEVKEAQDGDALTPGRALVAPGNFHMVLRRQGDAYRVAVRTGPPVCYQRPSVDVLFASVADTAGSCATGVLLTGMGSDGAQGLLRMKQAGARTIAQDEASCVIFGMPREAIRLGAADRVLPLERIAHAIMS
jgi:two-component system chemotaxis response regulator CheB